MLLNKFSLYAGSLLLLISGIAWSAPTFDWGPCIPSSSSWSDPGSCEPDCWFVCDDPVSYVTTTDGGCRDLFGPCTNVWAKYPNSVNRDCDCPFLGGDCSDEGLYNSGSQWARHCLGEPNHGA